MVLVIYSRQWYKKSRVRKLYKKGVLGGPSGTQRRGGMGKGCSRVRSGMFLITPLPWLQGISSLSVCPGH